MALIVDGARLPVYLAVETKGVVSAWPVLIARIVGVLLGTVCGLRLLRTIPEGMFRKLLYGLILVLGVYLAGIELRR